MRKKCLPGFARRYRVHYTVIFVSGCLLMNSCAAQTTDAKIVPKTAPPKGCNDLFIGLSAIFEDGGGKYFNTYGPTVAYTHALNGRFGITGDAGFYFGSNNGIDYTKLQLLGGASLLPQYSDKVAFSPHLLVGVANVHSKYSFNNMSFTGSNTAFSLAAGTNISFPINNRIQVAARADYNPTFASGGVKSNFRIGVGIDIKSGCPAASKDLHTTSKTVCEASSVTSELKMSFALIEEIIKSTEEIANKIPRVEAKITVKPQLTVKRGEECCSPDKPPVTYTELKGGVEGGMEININLWGIPDINYSLKLWPVLVVAEFKCKILWRAWRK